jgi:hypothetical protein
MRIFSSVIFLVLLFASFSFAQAQEKPLTQAEYVQLLYQLQQNPQKKDEVVDTVRKRGIAFVLTDGLRELTMSKSRSDETLKRTLEEANRRRENPTASQLPSESESKEIWAKAAAEVAKARDEMPDFIVKQNIARGVSYAGTNNFVSLDKLVIGVRYSLDKGEQFQLLRINGSPVDEKEGKSYTSAGGATSGGEFIETLADVFKDERKTVFQAFDTDVLLGRQCIVFNFEIALENSKGPSAGIGFKNIDWVYSPAGKSGKMWIDRQNFRILRFEYQATDILRDFPIKAFESRTDYSWTDINKEKYLLPVSSDVRFTYRDDKRLLQTRNVINFRNYNKYDVDIKLLDDEEPAEEEKPQQPAPPVEKKP